MHTNTWEINKEDKNKQKSKNKKERKTNSLSFNEEKKCFCNVRAEMHFSFVKKRKV